MSKKNNSFVLGTRSACVLILLQGTVYGLGDAVSKLSYQRINLYTMLTIRYAVAFVFMILVFGPRIIRELKACRIGTWITPCLSVAGAYLFSNLALLKTDATSVAFLRSTSVLMTPILMFLFWRKPIKKYHWFLVFVSLLGLYLICGGQSIKQLGQGELFGLMTAVFSAIALLTSTAALEHISSITLTAMEAAASMLFAILGCVFGSGFQLAGSTASVWFAILYLALVATIGGYLLQNLALMVISARTVSVLKCFCPVATAIFSFFLLGERLGPQGLLGAGLLIAAVITKTMIMGSNVQE